MTCDGEVDAMRGELAVNIMAKKLITKYYRFLDVLVYIFLNRADSSGLRWV